MGGWIESVGWLATGHSTCVESAQLPASKDVWSEGGSSTPRCPAIRSAVASASVQRQNRTLSSFPACRQGRRSAAGGCCAMPGLRRRGGAAAHELRQHRLVGVWGASRLPLAWRPVALPSAAHSPGPLPHALGRGWNGSRRSQGAACLAPWRRPPGGFPACRPHSACGPYVCKSALC